MTINLLGTSFTIQSDEDPAYLREILSYLEAKISEVTTGVKTTDPLKISILASLLLADELHKLKNSQEMLKQQAQSSLSSQEYEREVDEITKRLIRTIDECLS
ncbi:cell division protein ZapA [Spirochaeta lutea]|uniref:cell division protein ZapA n=1 Tax=Spirochaeta lutea TaxID=1480694 RepID=UPI00056500E5|nr:cell division protein ZapA [Spirochaeta lutea]